MSGPRGTALLSVLLLLCMTLLTASATASWRGRADSLFARADADYESGDYTSAADRYGAVLAVIEANGRPDQSPYFRGLSGRARFLRARSNEHLDRWDEAIPDYERSLTELSDIADAVHMRLAACQNGRGDLAAAVVHLRTVIDDESSRLEMPAILALAGYYEESGDLDMALQWYRVYLAQADSYDARALAHFRIGRVHDERGDERAALDNYTVAVNEYPRSAHADDALTKGRRISRSFTDRYHQGLVLYNRSRFRDAAEFFQHYLRHDDEGVYDHEASYFLGRSHQRQGNFRTAVRHYEEAIEFGENSEYYDLAWSKLAYCLRACGRTEDSLAAYDRYLAGHPGREAASGLAWEKARMLEENGRWEEARDAFATLASDFPDSEHSGDALFRAGLCLFKQERYGEAEYVFADILLSAEGVDAARCLFWAGKCREAISRPDEAAARYLEAVEAARDSYYGARAKERLRELGEIPAGSSGIARRSRRAPGAVRFGVWSSDAAGFASWLAEWYDQVYFPAGRTAIRKALHDGTELRRADVYLALHMRDFALAEISVVEEQIGSDPRALDILIDYCESQGLHKRAIRLAERILAMSPAETVSDAPLHLRRRICPTHFEDIVERYSREAGLDVGILYSLIRQESLFEPKAVSWVGARGLSQIMPRTGRWVARRLGYRGYRTSELFDPELNVWFGTEYLAMQVKEFDGDILRALAAYNGGADSAKRWWDYGGGRDSDVFVEDIGYAQTADYVRRIYRLAEVYRDIYGF